MSLKSSTMVVCIVILCRCLAASAQDERAQYPLLLKNSYIGLHVGYVSYPFSNLQMESGFAAESVGVPHLAVRALLFGHEFNRYLSAQVSYMRPIEWVGYTNVNGDAARHSVWMNVAGLTVNPQVPLTRALSIYAEGGLGIVTRKGFDINHSAAVKDANYGGILWGGGLQYRINENWNFAVGTTVSPAHSGPRQPRTAFVTAGLNHTLRPLSDEQVEINSTGGFAFPENLFQVGYTTNRFGYGVNNFVSKGAVPVFWAANVNVAHGLSMNYQRNVFHTRRVFSLNWGVGVSSWKTQKNGETFSTASFYPVLRFTPLHTRPLDLYINYSLAGPTFISRAIIDDTETGKRFTFQDFIGAGIFAGSGRSINAEIRIAHYSNGNLFPRNAGVTIPLSFNLGYTF